MSTKSGQPVVKRQGRLLPHWRMEGAAYHVVFRLKDSVPEDVARTWAIERERILSLATKRPSEELDAKLREINRRTEKFLDLGHGSKVLGRPRCASLVRDALHFYRGERYHLYAWCIMPNHVHAIVEPFPGNDLSQILMSWKSFTAHTVNTAVGRRGALWATETFDHIIRRPQSFERAVHYVRSNPESAGLKYWTWVSPFEDSQGRSPRWLLR